MRHYIYWKLNYLIGKCEPKYIICGDWITVNTVVIDYEIPAIYW